MQKQNKTVSLNGKEIIYFRESLFQSILADSFSYGILFGGVWFNYRFCGDSHFLNIVILLLFFLLLFAKGKSKQYEFTSRKSLLEHLTKEDDNKK